VRISFIETVVLVDSGRTVRLDNAREGFECAESVWSIVR